MLPKLGGGALGLGTTFHVPQTTGALLFAWRCLTSCRRAWPFPILLGGMVEAGMDVGKEVQREGGEAKALPFRIARPIANPSIAGSAMPSCAAFVLIVVMVKLL